MPSVTVSSGSTSSTGVTSGVTETVLFGGTVVATGVSSGGTLIDGGSASGTTVSSGGDLFITSGGTASGTVLAPPPVTYSSASGGYVNLVGGIEVVSAGGVAIGTEVLGGSESLLSGGVASGTVLSGSPTSSGTINPGIESVGSGAVAISTQIFNGGEQIVSSGGLASGAVLSNTTSSFGAYQTVQFGGEADATQIDSGTSVYVLGTTSNLVINGGGVETVTSGGTSISSTLVGVATFSNGYAYDNAFEYVESGGSAVSTHVGSGGDLVAFSGGRTSGSILSGIISQSGGYITAAAFENVGANALAIGTQVGSGGGLIVSSGGVASASVLSGAVIFTSNNEYAAAYENVDFGGSAVAEQVGVGGSINVASGGLSIDTVLSAAFVSSGSINAFGAYEDVSFGGIASGTTLDSGGKLNVSGQTFGTEVFGSGREVVSSGGVASGTTLLGATVYSGGVATTLNAGQVVSGGGSAIGTQVESGGRETVSSGGILSASTVSNGGLMVISSGGLAVGTQYLLGADLELNAIPFVGTVSPEINLSTDLLTVTEGGVVYTQQLVGNYAGEAFSASVDSAGTGTLLTLVATPVTVPTNGPPILQAPSSATITQYATTPLAFGLTESGNTSNETFTAILSDATGELSANGVGVTGSGTPFLTLSGSLNQVQDDLASIAVAENGPLGTEAGTDTIQFSASDSLGGSSGPTETALTINPQVTPVINTPAEATLSIGRPTPISGLSISEPGALDNETFSGQPDRQRWRTRGGN